MTQDWTPAFSPKALSPKASSVAALRPSDCLTAVG
eukprot:CAMPEP_0174289018 /NCGR_PEP_ID=MMETSP0809-20121228/23259_1 /TAXON_ID=73025 ORGANISM="Eutreptiella gymnastica-like, Strain CCMP1594" /NCGR_SAMPLE_ID=MMETSP0809 /ASSEMBLY_ACC=CAM_ASM_000658 /LENGTH=34 /DNA_ID= /DNA_START= /DNA_END= /DNA_ORIENTATION=